MVGKLKKTKLMINNEPEEFEPTLLEFKIVSDEYEIDAIREGFYVNGVKYEKSQPFENWRDLIWRK